MRRGDTHHDRGLAQQHTALAVPQHDPAEIGPAPASLVGERPQTGHDLLGEGLVIDMRDPGRAIGVVAHETVEEHHGTTIGPTKPFIRDPDVEHMVCECDPGVDVGRRYGHPLIVVGGAVTDAGHPSSVLAMAPDTPDNENGDQNNFGPHPHPDDRLWRHPSETGGPLPRSEPTVAASRPRTQTMRAGRSVLLPLVLIALVAGSGLTLIGLSVSGAFDTPPARVVVENVEASTEANLTTTEVVERIRPTLVRIETTRGSATTAATGVIYRSDGYVLTTADAVTGADSVLVITGDGNSSPARVVGIDPTDDIAVLSIGTIDIEPAVLGHPDELAPGEAVLAVSLDTSPTDPITAPEMVADNSRRFDAIDGSTLHDMIAAEGTGTVFDDAILCSDGGVILGIFTTRSPDPTASTNGDTDLQRTRFATPIDYAVKVADSIVRSGTARLAWLGVMSDDLDSTTTARIGRSGTILTDVASGGPADTAGLQVGDIIVDIDDSPVTSSTSLVVALRSRDVGDSVTVTYIREGAQRLTTTILGNRP